MVLYALNNNNDIVLAKDSKKGKYNCSYCKNQVFFVNESINGRVQHFKHKIECEMSIKFSENYDFYINDFYYKWTTKFIKDKYLYRYWNNEIYDIITPNNTQIIVRHNILKYPYYENDKNIIWILDGSKRDLQIGEVYYEDNTVKHIIISTNFYDFDLISKNHQLYIDFGKNQICKINYNLINNSYECVLVDIDEFINKYFKDIVKKEIVYNNEKIKTTKLYGFYNINNYIDELNYQNNNKYQKIFNENLQFGQTLKEYVKNYINNSDIIIIKIVNINTHKLIDKYIFLYDEKISDHFYVQFGKCYYKTIKNIKINIDVTIKKNIYYNYCNDKIKTLKNELDTNNNKIIYEKNKIKIIENMCNVLNNKITKINSKDTVIDNLQNENNELKNILAKLIYNNELLITHIQHLNNFNVKNNELKTQKHILIYSNDEIKKNINNIQKKIDELKCNSSHIFTNNEFIVNKQNEIKQIISTLKITQKHTDKYNELNNKLIDETKNLKHMNNIIETNNNDGLLKLYETELKILQNKQSEITSQNNNNQIFELENNINKNNKQILELENNINENNTQIISIKNKINKNNKQIESLCYKKVIEQKDKQKYSEELIKQRENIIEINTTNKETTDDIKNITIEIKKYEECIKTKNYNSVKENFNIIDYDLIVHFNNQYCKKINVINQIVKINYLYQNFFCINCNLQTKKISKLTQENIINNINNNCIKTYEKKLKYCENCVILTPS